MAGIRDLNIKDVDYTIFDFETTGLSYNDGDRVVEIACIRYNHTRGILREFTTLIHPGRRIPYEAQCVHGITDEAVRKAPKFRDVSSSIIEIVENSVLVAHNAGFDIRFLQGELNRLGINFTTPYICTMSFPGLIGGATRQSLLNACEARGIDLTNAHRAYADTMATTRLFRCQLDDALAQGKMTFDDLVKTKKKYTFMSSWGFEMYGGL